MSVDWPIITNISLTLMLGKVHLLKWPTLGQCQNRIFSHNYLIEYFYLLPCLEKKTCYAYAGYNLF